MTQKQRMDTHTATPCNILQHTAIRCKTNTATHCNTLQHTAKHCNTLQKQYICSQNKKHLEQKKKVTHSLRPTAKFICKKKITFLFKQKNGEAIPLTNQRQNKPKKSHISTKTKKRRRDTKQNKKQQKQNYFQQKQTCLPK